MIGKRISRDEASSKKKQIWIATATLVVVALILGIISNMTSSGVKKKEKKTENKKVELYTEPTAMFSGETFQTAPESDEEGATT